MFTKILLLGALVTLVDSAFALPTLPNFKMTGEGSVLEVRGSDKALTMRAHIQQERTSRLDERVIINMRTAGFEVGTSDTIHFMIPAEGCFYNDKLINCRTSKLKNRENITIRLTDSRNPSVTILQFNGADLDDDSLSFRFHTTLETHTNLDVNGNLHEVKVLKFRSTFWIHQDQQVHGHFSHDIALVNDL